MQSARISRPLLGRDICTTTGLYTPLYTIRTFITSSSLQRIAPKAFKRKERDDAENGRYSNAFDSQRNENYRQTPWEPRFAFPEKLDGAKWTGRVRQVAQAVVADPPNDTDEMKWSAAVTKHMAPTLKKGEHEGLESRVVGELKEAYRDQGVTGLFQKIKDYVIQKEYTENCSDFMKKAQRSLADLTHPTEWYTGARMTKRTWHLHVGPTNSGKTYNALKRLEEVAKGGAGMYAGPLRLLAHEIFERLNAKGLKCDLITGEERRRCTEGEKAQLTSCTVEMADTSKELDVAVIDEIQMIADEHRGWAWTQAVLGLKATELHLCGELRAIPIIEALAKLTGDKLIIHRYERLGPLRVQDTHVELKDLQKGDALVVFSRKKIYEYAAKIEKETGLKCAVVYGGLPAETRASQAGKFNDPRQDTDILVASDAIGMGLNLSIRRVIFSKMVKWDGTQEVPIPIPSVLQIAGRAGRYRSALEDKKSAHAEGRERSALLAQREELALAEAAAASSEGTIPEISETVTVSADAPPAEKTDDIALPAVGALPPAPRIGYVTTLNKKELPHLRAAMASKVAPITYAVLQPPADTVESFAQHFPKGTPFYMSLKMLKDSATTSPLFRMGSFEDVIEAAQAIEDIPGLTFAERFKMSVSPIKLGEPDCVKGFRAMASVVGKGDCVSVLDIKDVDLEALDAPTPKTQDGLKRLEHLHHMLLLYMWLGHRFPGNFTALETTTELKVMCELKIEQGLRALRVEDIDSKDRRKPVLDHGYQFPVSMSSDRLFENQLDRIKNDATA